MSEFGSDALEEIFGCFRAHFDDKVYPPIRGHKTHGGEKRKMRNERPIISASDFDFVL